MKRLVKQWPRSLRLSRASVLILLIALNLGLRSHVALRPLEDIDGLSIPDDAYLSLTLARNIAQGHGPQYGGQYTNGFQPLYVFLMVPVYRLIPHDPVAPVHVAILLMSLFDTLSLLLLFRLVQRLSTSAFTPILTALLWILHPRIIGVATNGLETALACFFVTWSLSYFQRHFAEEGRAPTNRECVRMGLLLGTAMMARIDCIFLVMVVSLAPFWTQRKAHRRSLGPTLLVNASALGAYLPWLIYSFAYTGDFYPISGSAVRLMSLAGVTSSTSLTNFYKSMMHAALRAIVGQNVPLIYISAILLVVVLSFRHLLRRPSRGNATVLAVCWGYAVALACAYIFYIFGPHFFDRYLHPVRIPLLITTAILLDLFFSLLQKTSIQVGATIIIAVSMIVSQCSDPYFNDLLFRKGNRNLGYMNLGLWAKSTFPTGTVVGSSQTGAVGYFADNLKVVNLDGVVNKRCFESLVRRTNIRYVREEGIQYVFGWKINFAFLVLMSKDYKPGDITDIKKISGFRSWNTDWYVGKVR